MVVANGCPQVETLRRYAIGEYDDQEIEHIESHLSSCDSCAERLASFDASGDSLLRHLPLTGTERDDDPPTGWLKRLAAIPGNKATDVFENRDAIESDEIENGRMGGYQLIGLLGKGGMGVVYDAWHQQLRRPVAIKVIHPKLVDARDAKRRFDREIQILGGLHHPGIVAATDAGRIGGAAYLVMERIDGVDLATLVRKLGPLSIDESCEVARQIAEALDAAHRAGAIHRDVKPSNVMINRNGQVKLLDFGLAHLARDIGPTSPTQESSAGRILGTLDFMAPEQLDGGDVTSRADLFGLGATLFFLLAGRPPRVSDRNESIVQQIKSLSETAPPRLVDLRADTPEELGTVVERLLHANPDDRPADGASVAAQLSRWVETTSEDTLGKMVQSVQSPLPVTPPSEVVQSLSALISDIENESDDERSDAPRDRTTRSSKPTRQRTHSVWKIALASTWIALLLCGVVLLLQTKRGTIRIESEVEGVTVELVDEKERVVSLQIEGTEEETMLRAGVYRVRLAGGHDSLIVQPNVIVLTKNETEIAKIQLEPNSATANDPSPDSTTSAEAKISGVYRGETYAVWRQRFELETEPESKVEAANAIVSLLSELSDEERIDRYLSIGGGLLADAYGDQLERAAVRMVDDRRFDLPRWPKNGTTVDSWRSFLQQAVDMEPIEIAKAIQSDKRSHADMLFGLVLLSEAPQVQRILNHQETLDWMVKYLDFPESDGIQRAAILLRAAYAQKASEEALDQFNPEMSAIGKAIADRVETDEDRSFARKWATTAKQFGYAQDALAVVVRSVLLFDTQKAMRQFFQSQWMASNEFPYPDAWMKKAREEGIVLWRPWVSELHRWLKEHPEDDANAKAMLQSLHIVLRVRDREDDWELAELRQQLAERLQRRHAAGSTSPAQGDLISTHDLLAYLVLADGELPEFYRDSINADPESLPTEIRRLNDLFAKSRQLESVRSELVRQRGLLQRYPVLTTATLIRAVPNNPESPIARMSLADQLRLLSDVAGNEEPPMEPLLLLAIFSELAGEKESQDLRIASLFQESHPSRTFGRHLRDAVSYPFAIRGVAEKWLEALRKNASDSVLKREVDKLLPAIDVSKN